MIIKNQILSLVFMTVIMLSASISYTTPAYADDSFSDEFLDEFSDEFSDEFEITAQPYDPLIKFNRAMFTFNDYLYVGVVKPVSTVTKAILPKPAEKGLRNVVRTIFSPLDILNYLLQGNPKSAAKQTGRLLINLTLGIGGLFNPADYIFKLPRESTTFGDTLGVWGVGQGPYIVFPVFGPSVLRDVSNSVFNFAASDLYMDEVTRNTTNAAGLLTGFWSFTDAYDGVRKNSLDPYIVVREFTLNNSKTKKRNKPEEFND